MYPDGIACGLLGSRLSDSLEVGYFKSHALTAMSNRSFIGREVYLGNSALVHEVCRRSRGQRTVQLDSTVAETRIDGSAAAGG